VKNSASVEAPVRRTKFRRVSMVSSATSTPRAPGDRCGPCRAYRAPNGNAGSERRAEECSFRLPLDRRDSSVDVREGKPCAYSTARQTGGCVRFSPCKGRNLSQLQAFSPTSRPGVATDGSDYGPRRDGNWSACHASTLGSELPSASPATDGANKVNGPLNRCDEAPKGRAC
jgi:hypothetical protein